MLSPEETVLRLLVASVLGGLIGIERERGRRAAGLRTHALVGSGSALFMLVSAYSFGDPATGNANSDPTRIAAQVVSGIGFLGAGAIFFQRNSVRGLTTAASIWTVAAIGLTAGAGMYFAAVAGTVVSLFILAILKLLERVFETRETVTKITVVADRDANVLPELRRILDAAKIAVEQIVIASGKADGPDAIGLYLRAGARSSLVDQLENMRSITGVSRIDVRPVVAEDIGSPKSVKRSKRPAS